MSKNIPRLYVDVNLAIGRKFSLTPQQTHYVANVMRRKEGDHLLLFNGADGEWKAQITSITKKVCDLECKQQVRPQISELDLWLLFAPIKSGRIDYLVEKATELGISQLQPVFTDFTTVTRVNIKRLQAHAVVAAEQCERLSVPSVLAPITLSKLLQSWDTKRHLLFCDERRESPSITSLLKDQSVQPWAILVGPEGGFSNSERNILLKQSFVKSTQLGPRILRSDTAAVAALSCYQAICGDWN